MEILWTEVKSLPLVFPILFLTIGAILLFLLCYSIYDKAGGEAIVVIALLAGCTLAMGILMLVNGSTEYTYARIPDTVPYSEVIEQYELVERQGEIYKLKAR